MTFGLGYHNNVLLMILLNVVFCVPCWYPFNIHLGREWQSDLMHTCSTLTANIIQLNSSQDLNSNWKVNFNHYENDPHNNFEYSGDTYAYFITLWLTVHNTLYMYII